MQVDVGADRTVGFVESVIREMTRRVRIAHPSDGINLAQGFPDFACPQVLKDVACEAIQHDVNQYAITWGAEDLRLAVAEKTETTTGVVYDPGSEITVTCGATEAMASTMLALLNPRDEVIVFEPYYENYGPDCALSGAVPRFVTLREPHWDFDPQELSEAFTSRTRAIVINTPNNPTGKVFSRQELEFILELCERWNTWIFTDEIYEHLVYDGGVHVSPASLPGARERTVVVNGLSKTYSVTGWRVGYTLAPAPLTSAIRKVHDFLTVGAAAPLQAAGVAAMHLPAEYYRELCEAYQSRRSLLVEGLARAGYRPYQPQGAYYVMADLSGLTNAGSPAVAQALIEDIGVAAVPGSSFFHAPEPGNHLLRFAFPKKLETLEQACARLLQSRAVLSRLAG